MSLFSALRTSVTGMNAQSSYLSAIGDNIANSSTTGYKEASTQFETVLGEQTPGSYESGGVLAQTRYGVTAQGTINSTTSSTDLAINGQGFFVVSNSATGTGTSLTRAGSFVPDQDGNLVNTAGYYLQGYKIGADGQPASDLSTVNISSTKLQAVPTTTGTISGNLPSTDATNATETTTATLFDSSGSSVTANISFTSNGDGTWNVSATAQRNRYYISSGDQSNSRLRCLWADGHSKWREYQLGFEPSAGEWRHLFYHYSRPFKHDLPSNWRRHHPRYHRFGPDNVVVRSSRN